MMRRQMDVIFTQEENASFKFVYGLPECTNTGITVCRTSEKDRVWAIMVKNLRVIWETFPQYTEANTLLVDHAPYRGALNPTWSSIHPFPWLNDKLDRHDKFLVEIMWPFLFRLSKASNVRQFMKCNEPKWSLDRRHYHEFVLFAQVYRTLRDGDRIHHSPDPEVGSPLSLCAEELSRDMRILVKSLNGADLHSLTDEQICEWASVLGYPEGLPNNQVQGEVIRARVFVTAMKEKFSKDLSIASSNLKDPLACDRNRVIDPNGSRRTCSNPNCGTCVHRVQYQPLVGQDIVIVSGLVVPAK